jgi:hypothetical protein
MIFLRNLLIITTYATNFAEKSVYLQNHKTKKAY